MLDRKWVLDNLEDVAASRPDAISASDSEELRRLSESRLELIKQVEGLRHGRKTASEAIGQKKRAGEDTEAEQQAVREIGQKISELEASADDVNQKLDELLLRIPNVPLGDVPDGVTEDDNVEVRAWGQIPDTADWRKPHWELGEDLGIIDLERGAKVSGSRFAFMCGLGARLERVLANWMMSVHADDGYDEVIPPYLVRPEALYGTGQLPKFAEDSFRTEGGDYYLIPTAEVPVTNMVANEILESDELPRKLVAFSPCFRAEAGAAGRDTRGIIRVHQFHKVELVRIERPEDSLRGLEELTAQAEKILQLLNLPYRVVRLCKGDLGFSAAMTYDLEVWLPGQQRWLEISSCSTFTDFQARRAKIRYRPAAGEKPGFVHTLNGSALAVGRTVVAIVENFQNEDGSITVPEPLREAMKVDKIA